MMKLISIVVVVIVIAANSRVAVAFDAMEDNSESTEFGYSERELAEIFADKRLICSSSI